MIETGKLKKLIESGLRGMTSNPTIFHQAISSCNDYDDKIVQFKEAGKSTFEIYDELTIRDIQDACDIFKNVYRETQKLDGYVSLEINPKIANDAQASIKEGERLFQKVNRPNVMIKVPATQAGFTIIEELLAKGVNVNVTLIFSLNQYSQTVNAFLKGMERFSKRESELSQLRSVASVFVSRIDTSVDKLLDEKIHKESNPATKDKLQSFKGKAAVGNCDLIYAKFKELFSGKTFKALAQKKCQVQRVLWGSTSTKNPAYSDIKYVTELIAPNTVNTMPENTLNAFLDHGEAKEGLQGNTKEAEAIFKELKTFGIDINDVCLNLLKEGVVAFEKSFDSLLEAIEKKAQQLCHRP